MQPTLGGHEEFQLYGRGLSDQNGVCIIIPHFRPYVYGRFGTAVLHVRICILYLYNTSVSILKCGISAFGTCVSTLSEPAGTSYLFSL